MAGRRRVGFEGDTSDITYIPVSRLFSNYDQWLERHKATRTRATEIEMFFSRTGVAEARRCCDWSVGGVRMEGEVEE